MQCHFCLKTDKSYFLVVLETNNTVWKNNFENDIKVKRINYGTFLKDTVSVLFKMGNLVCCKSVK
jgi:hypothetical protein